jgi:predicted Zn-dependent peptidase
MLLEGTVQHSAKQIADIIAFYGASLECNQGFDRASLTLYCLSHHFQNLLPFIHEVLTTSTFPDAELDLLKKRTIQNISIEKQKNNFLATYILTQNIYGQNHPYVTSMDEYEVDAVLRDDIANFYNTNYNLSEAEIILAGDFNEVDIAKTKEYFSSIGSKTFTQTNLQKDALKDNQTHFLEKPEKLQSSIRIGCSWPLINNIDFPKLSLLNKILGGYFGSRLMKNIREEKGFTYGIFSAVSPKEKDTLFYIGTDVNYQNTEETVSEIYKEIKVLQEELISEEELSTVKAYTIGKFINDSATIFDQSDKYRTLITHQLPANHYSNYLNTLQNVTPLELQELANTYLKESLLNLVIVGRNKD